MSVQGIISGAGAVGRPAVQRSDRPAPEEARGPALDPRVGGSHAAEAPSRASGAVGRPTGPLPAEAPPGTDPALWSVLTTEERAYYARVRSLGPLTYRPDSAATRTEAPVRGGRLDVKA